MGQKPICARDLAGRHRNLPSRRHEAAFGHLGYEQDHQTGSHVILRRSDPPHRRLSVPDHKELAKGTLRALIRQAGLTVGQFVELVDR